MGSVDRKALQRCLDNWHAREPLPASVRDTGCFLDVLMFGLLVFAVISGLLAALAAASMWLEEDRGHCVTAAANVVRAQCAELQPGREGQDAGHGTHRAVEQGGRA